MSLSGCLTNAGPGSAGVVAGCGSEFTATCQSRKD